MEALSALCDELIRPEPPPSHFVGLFVQLSPWRPQACSWVWKRLYWSSMGTWAIHISGMLFKIDCLLVRAVEGNLNQHTHC